MDELKKDLRIILSFFDPLFKFSKKRTNDYKDDSSFDQWEWFLKLGIHNMVWYAVLVALVFLFTFIIFRQISIWNLIYTILIFLAGKFLFERITGK
jgi:hypothetical protein